jgi:hypothetical protein
MNTNQPGYEPEQQNQAFLQLGTTALRLQGALGGLHLPPDMLTNEDDLHGWLGRMILPVDSSSGIQTQLAVSMGLHDGALTWFVIDSLADMLLKLGDELAEMPVDPAQMAQFTQITDALLPRELGAWLRMSGPYLEAGWSISETVPLQKALSFAADTRDARQLQAWTAAQGVVDCHYLEGSFSPGNPYLTLHFPLPGDTADAQLDHALSLFDSLQLGGPPDDALSALLHYSAGGWLATVSLTAKSVSCIGIVLQQPSTRTVLHLSKIHDVSLVTSAELAAFEGALGVDGATSVESVEVAGGHGLSLHYRHLQ